MIQQKLATAINLLQRGEIEESDLMARAILARNPKSAGALQLRGVIAGLQDRHSDAERFLIAASKLDKKNFYILFNLAKSLSEQGRDKEALGWHRRALELDSANENAWLNYGLSLNRVGDLGSALSAFDRALAINDCLAEAYSNKGTCLRAMGGRSEALALQDRAVELSPSLAEAWSNRGAILNELKRHEEALASYDRAIELKSDCAEAWGNRGTTLRDLDRHEEALASYDRAIELKPDYAEAWGNRGVALAELGRQGEALSSYDRAVELDHNCAEALHNKALLQLANRDFLSGFENYLRRWEMKNFASQPLKTILPLCGPTVGGGGRVLLWAEQGIGDEIFYAGMLSEALERFSNICLVADKRLHPIFSRSFPGVTLLERDRILEPEVLNELDFQAPVGDLGHILGLDSDTVMSTRRPFLVVDGEKSSRLKRGAAFSSRKIVCGLSWRSHNKSFGEEKSISLETLEPILKNNQFEFINLQYGDVDSEIQKVRGRFNVNIHRIESIDVYNDIDGLLALIDACDMVITTSSVTAHLAGSIGKKGCIFVPFSKGKLWYWHFDGAFSLWYPSLKVFHQENRYDWTSALIQAKTWVEQEASWR